MRTTSRLLLGVSLTAAAVLGPALPSLAAGSGTATVGPAAEAWYRGTPSCGLPTGCADAGAAPSPYSPDTLHVGVNAGAEEARTYLQLDLTSLPAGTKPSGGTLLLPVATGTADGTRAPESAELRACAVEGEVTDVDGSFATPPEADCDAAAAPATFVPAKGDDPPAFTVDLAALTAVWNDGTAPGALALVPAAETAPPDSWHVALHQRTRTGAGVAPISAALALVSAAVDTSSVSPPSVPAPAFASTTTPAFAPSFDGAEAGSGTSFAAPPLASAPLLPAPAAQTGPAPQAAAPAPQQVVPVASFVASGFRYPAVFLLPLLLALAVGWLGRALTRELVDPLS